jgi:hypothetical protein
MSAYAELMAWRAGTPDGGPNGDGRYPLTDAQGNVYMLLCPAADQAANDNLAIQPETFANAAMQARDEAVLAQGAAEAAASAAALSETAAGNAVTAAEQEADASAASATAAQGSEMAAEGHATTATNQAQLATTKAGEASASANAAAGSASDAAGSATSASDSAAEAHSWALTAETLVTGLLRYRGAYDASSGMFPANPVKGDFWKIQVAGTVSGVDLAVGDQIIFADPGWDKIDNTETVTAVAGRVGSVVLEVSDIGGLLAELSLKYDKTGGDLSGDLRIVKAATVEAQFELDSGVAIARHFYRDTDWNYGMYLTGADGLTKTRFRFDGTNMSVETPLLKMVGMEALGGGSFGGLVRVASLGAASGDSLVVAAGEAVTHMAPLLASGENLHIGSESGVLVYSSPDNMSSGLAGMYVATLLDSSGNTLFPGKVSASGGFFGGNLQGDLSTGWMRLNGNVNADVGGSIRILTGGASMRYYYNGSSVWMVTSSGDVTANSLTVADTIIAGTVHDSRMLMKGMTSSFRDVQLNYSSAGNLGLYGVDGAWVFRIDYAKNVFVYGDLYRGRATGSATDRQPRIFVQSSDPGSGAADGDLWFW